MAAELRNSRVTAPRDFTPKHPLAGKKLVSSALLFVVHIFVAIKKRGQGSDFDVGAASGVGVYVWRMCIQRLAKGRCTLLKYDAWKHA